MMGCATSKLSPVVNAERNAVAQQSSPTNCSRSMGMDNAEPLTMGRVESAQCLHGEGLKTIRTAPQSKDTLEHDLETSEVTIIQTANKDFASSDASLTCSYRKISNLSIVCAFILHATIIFIGKFVVDDRAAAPIKPDAPCQQHQTDASDETDLILKASLLIIKGELLEKERLRLAAMKRYAESIGLSQPSSNPRVVDLRK